MPQFVTVSRDGKGERVTAVTEAENRQGLLTQLKGRGLTVVEVRELGATTSPRKEAEDGPNRRPRFSMAGASGARVADLAIFWREFSTMVGAGLPVVEALESIAQEMEHVKLRRVLNEVIANMWEGFNLSQSLSRHPNIFPSMVVALIGAAEESGSLPEITDQLADFLEKRDRLIRKVRAALTYPIFLCGFFLVVLAVATFGIIPKFRDIYSGFNAKLPWLTETVFAINALVLEYFPWLLAAGAAGILAFLLWSRKPSGRAVIDRVLLKIPIFGELLRRAAVARFCRSLATLLSGGIPINRALEMAENTAGNTVIARAIRNSRQEILKGGKIATSLRQQEIFPHMVVRMVSAGEETGSLAKLLEKTADFYEARVDATLTTINALIEPVLIIVIGGFVLIFVLALYMPIFSLAGTMRG